MRPSRTATAALILALVIPACGDGPDASGDGSLRLLPPVRSRGLVVSSVVMPAPVTPERAALYMTVANPGSVPDTLTGVDAGGLGTASVHRTTLDRGVARMRAAGPVAVPPAGTVAFRPGGLHVMVDSLTRAPVPGDTVPLFLDFVGAGTLQIRALVVPYAAVQELLGGEG